MPSFWLFGGSSSGPGGGASTADHFITYQSDADLTNQILTSVLHGFGTLASLPAAGHAGFLYFATDTFQLYRDNGASWDKINPYGDPVPIAHGGTALASVGAAGTFLGTTDGATLGYKQPPYVWQYDAGAAAWSNDSTAHSILASTKSFPTMAVGDQLSLRAGLTWLNNSGAGQTLNITLLNGAVTLGSVTTASVTANASKHLVGIDITLTCKTVGSSLTGAVLAVTEINVSIATAATMADAIQATTSAFAGGNALACATDGTGGALDIQAKMSTLTATSTITPTGLSAIYYPKLV